MDNNRTDGTPFGCTVYEPSIGVVAMWKLSRTAEIERAGVVQLPEGDYSFIVNGENLEELIRAEVKKKNPRTDAFGQFAAKVTIRVELLGDLGAAEG